MFAATIRKNCGVMLIIGGAEVTMEVDSKKKKPHRSDPVGPVITA